MLYLHLALLVYHFNKSAICQFQFIFDVQLITFFEINSQTLVTSSNIQCQVGQLQLAGVAGPPVSSYFVRLDKRSVCRFLFNSCFTGDAVLYQTSVNLEHEQTPVGFTWPMTMSTMSLQIQKSFFNRNFPHDKHTVRKLLQTIPSYE